MADEKTFSFVTDIRPMFTDTDIIHMKPYGFDLGVYADVVKNSEEILDAVASGEMPPKADGGPWSGDMCDTFRAWMQQGCPP